MNWRKMSFLAFGHFASDFYPGLLAPLLPLLTIRFGWSLAQTGVLVMVMSIFMNGLQPFIGLLNDRYPLKSFLWLGPLLSAIPFAFILYLDDFHLMLAALSIAGLGVAMFHPVGAVASGHNVDEKRSVISMAAFSSGGSMGVTVAPLVMVFILGVLGESAMPVVLIPAILILFLASLERNTVVSEHEGHTIREMFASIEGNGRELFILWLVSGFRAIVYGIVSNFLALLLVARGYSYSVSAYFLSAALLAGMFGMFIGGHLADKHGKRKIMAISLFLSTPLLYGFSCTTGAISIAFLLLGMVSLTATLPVNIVLAQRMVPRLPGMASSLVMGLSFLFSAIAAPPFGVFADKAGIETAMRILFIIPVIAGGCVFLLRKE